MNIITYPTIQDGQTALEQASIKGHPNVVEFLLGAGANPNLKDKVGKFIQGGSSLEEILPYTCRIQRWFARLCLLFVLSPQNGQSALMLAGNSGHTDVVQLLLSRGAKIDMQNKVRHDINQ